MMKRMMMLMKRKSSKMMFGPPSLVSLDGFSSCDRDAYGDEHEAAYDDAFVEEGENGDDHDGGDDGEDDDEDDEDDEQEDDAWTPRTSVTGFSLSPGQHFGSSDLFINGQALPLEMQCNAIQCNVVQTCSSMDQHCPLKYKAVQCNVVQDVTDQQWPSKCSAMQCNVVHFSSLTDEHYPLKCSEM